MMGVELRIYGEQIYVYYIKLHELLDYHAAYQQGLLFALAL